MFDTDITSAETTTKTPKKHITVGVDCQLKLADARLLAYQAIPVNLSPSSYTAMEHSLSCLKAQIEQRLPVYGVNTHFGDQVNFFDAYLNSSEQNLYYQSINARQENLLRSHVCGLGDTVAPEAVRVAMMLRAHCLAQGYSGVAPQVVEAILSYLNAGITPVVPCYGSIGASGDLIPLATIAASVAGENVDVLYKDRLMKSTEAIEIAGLKKFKPELRDGLAMINGTSFMTAVASLALYDLNCLFKQMLFVVAMSLESMQVINSAYHPLVHQLKRQAGEIIVNHLLLDFWQGSQLIMDLDKLRQASMKQHSEKTPVRAMQDFYSLRAVSQGFGPLQENLERATQWIENEMNSVNDNPIIDVSQDKIYHNANFMGYYVTDACDILKMNIAQASSWLHALLANLVHPRKNHNLPTNLVENPDKYNGFRPLQLLAASLTVQNRKLAQSHQAFMLPTEGDNQDVNSLGMHAALDLRDSVMNLTRLTAILLLASTQALELRGFDRAGQKSQAICEVVRKYSPKLGSCRPMSEEINTIVNLLKEGTFNCYSGRLI